MANIEEGRSRIQQALRAEFASHPKFFTIKRRGSASDRDALREIAARVGCSESHARNVLNWERSRRIGEAVRAKEAEQMTKAVAIPGANLAVRDFTNWADFFFKLQTLANGYRHFARSRGDVWAAAFLDDVFDQSEQALKVCHRRG